MEGYSKFSIDNALWKRGMSIEEKESILIKKLHEAIVKPFLIDEKVQQKNF